jgi:hypothetical protein
VLFKGVVEIFKFLYLADMYVFSMRGTKWPTWWCGRHGGKIRYT